MEEKTPSEDRSKHPVEESFGYQKKTGHSRHRCRKFCAVFLVLILIGSTVYISRVKNRYQKNLREITLGYQDLKSRDAEIKSIKSRRVEFFRIQSFLNYPVRFSFTASAFIRRLSLIDLKDIYFLELNMVPHQQNISFFIKGLVQGPDGYYQKKILNVFCLQLKTLDGIFEISCFPEKRETERLPHLNFTLNGKIEVE